MNVISACRFVRRWIFVAAVCFSGGTPGMAAGEIAGGRDGENPFDPGSVSFEEWIPARMPADRILPSADSVSDVHRWSKCAFGGVPLADDDFSVSVMRQDHGTFHIGKSGIGTSPLVIGERKFTRGFGTHANSELVVRLPEDAVRFSAVVGIDRNDDTRGLNGSVRFGVAVGGRDLWWSEVRRGSDDALPVELELPPGTRELTLLVDATPDGTGWDHADWCDPQVVTKDGKTLCLDEAGIRRPAFEVAIPFSFVYDGKSSGVLLPAWKFESIPVDERNTIFQWTDPETGLVVSATVRLFDRYCGADWVLRFRNGGAEKTPILENVQTLDMNFIAENGRSPAILHTLKGDSCDENSWLPVRREVVAGRPIHIAPVGGRSSNGAFPFWNLQRAPAGDDTPDSDGVFIAVGWSGQWAARFDRSGDRIRVTAGMEKIHTVLEPGEEIRLPRVLLMPWRSDRLSAHALFRRMLMEEYAPHTADGLPQRLPVVGQCFDRYYRKRPGWERLDGQLAMARKLAEAGCDTGWFDAAWFPVGFPNGVGNWFADREIFPDGLRPLTDAVHELGMEFVLWFEPERVAPGTWLANEYPQFVFVRQDGLQGGQRGGLWRLDDPDARRFLTDHLSRLIEEYGVDVYRNDFNIDPLPFWRGNDTEDRQGITEIRYVEGHYAMWNELRVRHPGLWIDNCASGGRRIDLETLSISVPLWRSDTFCFPGNVEWNQNQTLGIAQYLPLYGICAWEPDPYTARSAAHAGLIVQYDFLGDGYDPELAAAAVAEAKVYRKFWCGDFYPLSDARGGLKEMSAWQLHRSDLEAGLVYVFRRDESIYTACELPLRGVDKDAVYEVTLRPDYSRGETRLVPGSELEKIIVSVPERRMCVVVEYRKINAVP